MKLRYLTLLFPLLFPLTLQAQEEPSWWKAFESFKWLNGQSIVNAGAGL